MPQLSAAGRSPLPARLVAVVVLLGAAIFLNYIDRGNLSIAAPMLKDELRISAAQLGFLLSAFFWTYSCMQVVSGWLVDRFNVNWVLAGGFFLWSAATAVTGVVHALALLVCIRLLLGIGESVAFPSCSKIVVLNFAEEHRGTANSIFCSGLLLGPGFGMLVGGTLMARFGWRPFFVVLGMASLLWLVPWIKFMPRATASHASDRRDLPGITEFLRLRSAWGTFLGLFCGNYGNYFLITWLPYYLVRERHFSMFEMAKIGGFAYLAAAAATVGCGWLSDHWIRSGATPSLVRKTFTGGGCALTGLSLLASSLGGQRMCIAMVTLAVVGLGMSASNVYAITQRFAGAQAAGRWTGLQGCIGNMAGIVVPAVTGLVVQRTGRFFWAFVILAAFELTGAALWVWLVPKIEPVAWKARRPVELAAT